MFDGRSADEATELDAVIAYLQMLGTLVDFASFDRTPPRLAQTEMRSREITMTYETVATFSQVSSLILFIAMFIGAVAYALWPSNQPKFEKSSGSHWISGLTPTDIGGR